MEAAILIVLGAVLLIAGVPLRWAIVVLAAAAVLTLGSEAFVDELSGDR